MTSDDINPPSCSVKQVGMILSDEVEVGMADFYVTAQRSEVIDISEIIDVAK